MKFSVEHLGLPARNPLRLKDWYVTVLGANLGNYIHDKHDYSGGVKGSEFSGGSIVTASIQSS